MDCSTIKRSGHIIVLGNDGKVAETGTFEELSSRDGPFTRLMEWQINGGEAPLPLYKGHPVEAEEEIYEAEAEEERRRREETEAAELEEEEAAKAESSKTSA
jgi:putative ABC transport system ATP-binding protein